MVGSAVLLLTGVLSFDPTFTAAEPAPDAVMGDGLELIQPSDPIASTCAAGEKLKGIDVSKWQGHINWDSVANAGVQFAFVRVSDGLNYFDPRFKENWDGARDAGIHTGVYQFFRPNQNAVAQADLMIEHMGELQPGDLPPVIDVEATGGLSSSGVASKVAQWIDRVESVTGVRPIIYSGKYFWRDNVGDDQYGDDYSFWIAHYTNGCPNLPPQWDNWVFHQYSESGHISGISGSSVDMDYFNGSYEDLLSHTIDSGDLPKCEAIAAEGGTIDNDGLCFDLHGPSKYWRTASSAEGGLNWTNSTKSTVYNSATWSLSFEEEGDYLVEAHIEPGFAGTHNANYEVLHDGVEDVVSVDQATATGWTVVGTFGFAAGGNQMITLADKTGESSKAIAFDAIRVTATGTTHIEEDDGAALPSGGSRGEDEAVGCSIGAKPSSAGWMLLVLFGAIRRRRRA